MVSAEDKGPREKGPCPWGSLPTPRSRARRGRGRASARAPEARRSCRAPRPPERAPRGSGTGREGPRGRATGPSPAPRAPGSVRRGGGGSRLNTGGGRAARCLLSSAPGAHRPRQRRGVCGHTRPRVPIFAWRLSVGKKGEGRARGICLSRPLYLRHFIVQNF